LKRPARIRQLSKRAKALLASTLGQLTAQSLLPGRSDEVQLAKFPYLGNLTDAYWSLLYLQQVKEGGPNILKSWSGREGI
jgi:hypothetical protein